MLQAGLALSRQPVDFCLLDVRGERSERRVAHPDADNLSRAYLLADLGLPSTPALPP